MSDFEKELLDNAVKTGREKGIQEGLEYIKKKVRENKNVEYDLVTILLEYEKELKDIYDNDCKKFKVKIVETLSKTVEIMARNEDEARFKVGRRYMAEEFVLTADDFEEVEFYIE